MVAAGGGMSGTPSPGVLYLWRDATGYPRHRVTHQLRSQLWAPSRSGGPAGGTCAWLRAWESGYLTVAVLLTCGCGGLEVTASDPVDTG